MKHFHATVSASGRLGLPAALRRTPGLEKDGPAVIAVHGREVRLQTLDESVREAQEITRRALGSKAGVSVEGFLAERRREGDKY